MWSWTGDTHESSLHDIILLITVFPIFSKKKFNIENLNIKILKTRAKNMFSKQDIFKCGLRFLGTNTHICKVDNVLIWLSEQLCELCIRFPNAQMKKKRQKKTKQFAQEFANSEQKSRIQP